MDTQNFDHLQSPVLIVAKDGTIKYYNFVCSLFFKLPPRKLAAIKNISEIIQTKDYSLLDSIKDSLSAKSPVVSPEILITTNNILYTVILKFIPIGSDIVLSIQDFSIERNLHDKYKQQLSELKATHEQIVKSDKLTALGELIAGISHEISSPLTVAGDIIGNMSEHLHTGRIEDATEELYELEAEFSRIKKIVSDMQGMSKNKNEIMQVISLKDAVENSLDFLTGFDHLSGIKLDKKSLDSIILGDESKLQQVIINLLKNAIDALTDVKKKEIKIYSEIVGKSVQLHFKDNGYGIKDPEKIFEMFYTTKEAGDGTGLGLTISQKIMRSFHGNINIVEETQGAHFYLEFPNLEIESFTTTNKYLVGGSEIEDNKLLVYSDSIEILNFIYKEFSDKNIVLILTDNASEFEDSCESYMVDYAVSFDSKVKVDGYNYICLKGKTEEEILKQINEVISE